MFEICKTCPVTRVKDCQGCPHKPGTPQVVKFEPYVDIHTTGKPTLLETRAQRDAFHAQNGVTLDSNRYGRRRKPKSGVDEVSTAQVMADLKSGNFPRAKKKLPAVEGEPLRNCKI